MKCALIASVPIKKATEIRYFWRNVHDNLYPEVPSSASKHQKVWQFGVELLGEKRVHNKMNISTPVWNIIYR